MDVLVTLAIVAIAGLAVAVGVLSKELKAQKAHIIELYTLLFKASKGYEELANVVKMQAQATVALQNNVIMKDELQ